MSVDVYPAVNHPPLRVRAGTDGPATALANRAGADPVTGRTMMYLRIVQIGDGTARPLIHLSAGNGDETEPGTAPTPVRPRSGPAVALATLVGEPDGVQLVEIEILRPHAATGWRLRITNADTRDHDYVWTVADSEPGTRRPWLDVPETRRLRVFAGELPDTTTLPIANRGPGTLTITTPDGTDLGAGTVLRSITPRTIGPNALATATVTVTPPSQGPVSPSVTYPLASDDPLAGARVGHDGALRLDIGIRARPSWVSGDVLVRRSANGSPEVARLDRATGTTARLLLLDAWAADLGVDPGTGDAALLYYGTVAWYDRVTGAETAKRAELTWTPRKLAVDREGTAHALLYEIGSVQRVRRSGTVDFIPLGVSAPTDLLVESDGVVLVANVGGHAGAPDEDVLRRVRLVDGTATTLVRADALPFPVPGYAVVSLAVEPSGAVLLLCPSETTGTLFRVDPGTGVVAPVAERPELASASDIAVDRGGTILVAGMSGLLAVDPVTGASTPVLDEPVDAVTVVPTLDNLA